MDSDSADNGMTATAGEDAEHRELAVGCFASICRDRLADELLVFSRNCPSVDIGVHEMPRGALLSALKAGDLSLAVLPGKAESGTRSTEIWQDRVMVAVPPGHALATQPAVRPSELRGHTILVSRQQFGGDMHRFLTRMVLPLGPTLDSTIVDIGLPRIIGRVAQGQGIALICESHAEHLAGEVTVRPIDAPGARFPVRAYWTDTEPAWPLSALIRSLDPRD
jgi:DNA-binding transcriptional LysR family regulator